MQTPTNPPSADNTARETGLPASPLFTHAAHDFGPLIRLPATLALVGLGRSAWLDLVNKGKAPPPIKIGRASLWHEPEIRAFIADRVRQSREVL